MFRSEAVVYIVSLVCCHHIHPVVPSTHWFVTEEGKIQPQVNSIFHMKRPYDFVSFMEQEKRVDMMEQLKIDMFDQNLDYVEEQHDPELEMKFFAADRDCQEAGQPLTEFDLFVSTLINPDSSLVRKLLSNNMETDHYSAGLNSLEAPVCSKYNVVPLGELMFDDFSAVLNRHNLKMPAEIGLILTVLENGKYHLPEYGHLVARALEEDNTNWLANHMAANYWRIKGRPTEAVECLRRSIRFAPPDQRHIGYLGLANVFHRTQNSEDAVNILQMALSITPHDSAGVVHFTLGNIYATLLQFNQSVFHYGEVLRWQPSFDAARIRRHAVRCHQKLELALEEQHDSLQKTLKELRKYKKQHEKWTALLTKIINEQANIESRMESRMEYEQLKMLQSENGRGQDCVQYQQRGHKYTTCNIRRDDGINLTKEKNKFDDMHIEDLLKTFEDRVESIGIKPKNESEVDPDLVDPKRPSKPARYATYPPPIPPGELPLYAQPGWPTKYHCSQNELGSNPPEWNDYPSVFLSPENKGFDVWRMMSLDIELPRDKPMPLPWYPPYCLDYKGHIPKYDRLKTIKEWTHIRTRIREKEIEHQYVVYSPEKDFHEWGARVGEAMRKNLAPKWLVFLLAGTYWRIFGHPQNGIHCYRHALSRVPDQYKDVVLTNFAGLLYKTGAIDEALVMVQDALRLDDKDPDTNFFLANMLSAKGNHTGAIHHYRQALRMEPGYAAAYQYLHVPSCQLKFDSKTNADSCAKDLSAACLNKDSLTQIEGTGAMIRCKDGHCKFVEPEEEMMAAEKYISDDATKKETKVAQKSNDSNGQTKKKKKRKKKVKKSHKESFDTVPLPKQGEDTILMNRDQMKDGLPVYAVEIGTIAESVDADDDDPMDTPESDHRATIGPIHLEDDELPEVLLRVRQKAENPVKGANCHDAKEVNWDAFTSTWLSVSAKGIDIREYLVDDFFDETVISESKAKRPYCDPNVPASLRTMDHLIGVKMRRHLHFASEGGLQEAFQGLTGDTETSVEDMATRVAVSLERNSTSWVLSTAAALYWRVRGNSEQAINCLRHSLYHAPDDMQDIPLISLANILHRAGLYNNALVVTNKALEISPKFVVIHFTMGNIYVSKDELDMALSFYRSTLALQSTFEPAWDRLMSIHCNQYEGLHRL